MVSIPKPPPSSTTKVSAARISRLTALFFVCLALSHATTATPATFPDADTRSAEAATLTNQQQKQVQGILLYEDGKAYDYCEANYPTDDTYPAPPVEGATLTNVQLFIRHGDRTSQSFYKVDHQVTFECSKHLQYNSFTSPSSSSSSSSPSKPFYNATLIANQIIAIPQDSPFGQSIWKGSCIPGQLTPKGAEQHERLGRALREIYVDGRWKILPNEFQQDKVFVRSTDYWRTRQSATSLLTGLYGSNKQPPHIQLTTLPVELEFLVFNERGQCPRISQLKAQIAKTSPVLQKLYKSYAQPIQDASKIINPPKVLSFDQVYDFVFPRVCHQLPMPCIQDGEGKDRCVDEQAVTKVLATYRNTETAEMFRDAPLSFELLKIGFGPVAAMVRKNILQAKEGVKGQAAFSLYSGHDTTLVPLLGVLDSLDMRWPPYMSNILFELWETPSSESYIRVIYNNKIVTTKSNWCDLSWCPLQTFLAHLEKFLPGEDYIEKCQALP
ncbi:MAG: histidine phosphatase superfamily [Linnemannia gamsii]|nr:MAG: histidine phosphatase superfamily [Linnemannia gamsii]